MKEKIVTVKCDSYADCEKSVASACKKSGLSVGKKVFVKVNMLLPTSPKKAITTHPEILRAILHQLEGKDVVVGESSGGRGTTQTDRAFEKTGILAVCKDEGVPAINLTKEVDKKQIGEFVIPNVVLDRDVISLAKLKTHSLTGYTGAVKNLFGCLPGAQKWQMHQKYPDNQEFVDMLFRLHDIIKPKFSLIDGVWGMEGDGPSNGTPKHARIVIAGKDAIATDVVASRTIGVDYPKTADVESIGEVSVPFKKAKRSWEEFPVPVKKAISKMIWMRPKVNETKCVKCGICAHNCPVGAIEMKPYPVIDRSKCIECFCCHELCPHKAMEIERSTLAKIFL